MTDDELNRLCATKIMGYEFFRSGYFATSEETPRMRELEEWMQLVELDNVGDYYIQVGSNFWISAEDWNPCSDIAQAWQVVEKMIAQEYDCMIEWGAAVWYVRFVRFTDRSRGIECHASVSRSISVAALRAVGVEVEP